MRIVKFCASVLVLGIAGWVLACTSEKSVPLLVSPVAVGSPEPVPSPSPTASPRNPMPEATPIGCPTLTAWTSRIFNITDAQNRSATEPSEGGHVVIDSTPLFGGRECNAEHRNNCGGRHCEDPEGADWTLLEGTSPATPQVDGYQLRIGPLRPGTHRWRVCPRPEAEDEDGERLIIGPDPCSEGEFYVPPR